LPEKEPAILKEDLLVILEEEDSLVVLSKKNFESFLKKISFEVSFLEGGSCHS